MSKKHHSAAKVAMPPPRPWWRISAWVGVVLVGLTVALALIAQAFTLGAMRIRLAELEQSQGGIIDEVGRKLTVAEQLVQLQQDLNEARSALALPEREYVVEAPPSSSEPPSSAPSTEDEQGEQDPTARGLFLVVDSIKVEQVKQAAADSARVTLETLRTNEQVLAPLTAAGLAVASAVEGEGDLVSLSLTGEGKRLFRRLTFHRDTGEWEIYAPETGGAFYATSAEFEVALRTLLGSLADVLAADERATALGDGIDAALGDAAIVTLLQEKQLTVDGRSLRTADGASRATLAVATTGDAIILTIGGEEQRFLSTDELLAALPDAIARIDTRTAVEKRVAAAQEELEATLRDATFLQLLAEAGLHLADAPDVGPDRISYKLLDAAGQVVRQVVVERSIAADVLVVDAEGLNPITFEDLIAGVDPKARSTSRRFSPN